MTEARARSIGDLVLSALVLAGAGLLVIGAADLPPPRFEPLGSAALPRILAAILAILATIIALRAVLALRRAAPAASATKDGAASRSRSGVLTFAALLVYVASLDFLRLPFAPMTALFLGTIGLVISGGKLKAGAIYLLLGGALGALLSFVFSTFLYISIG